MKRFLNFLFIITLMNTAFSAVTLDIFYMEGCGDCDKALIFLKDWSRDKPGLVIRYFDILTNSAGSSLFQDKSLAFGIRNLEIPTIFINNTMIIGFDSTRTPLALNQALQDTNKTLFYSKPPVITFTNQQSLNVTVTNQQEIIYFHGYNCPGCLKALEWLTPFTNSNPMITLKSYEIRLDKTAQELYREYRKTLGFPNKIPIFIIKGKAVSGFDPITTPSNIIKLLQNNP